MLTVLKGWTASIDDANGGLDLAAVTQYTVDPEKCDLLVRFYSLPWELISSSLKRH